MENMEDIVDGTSGTDENGCSLPPDIASDMKWLRVVLYDQKSIDAISRIESTILDLTEQVRVRDEAMRLICNECSANFFEPCMEKMEVYDCSECQIEGDFACTEAIIKSALDAAKEGKNDGSN
jgi:hypothetical protein